MSKVIRYGMGANPREVDAEWVAAHCVGAGWKDLIIRLVDDLFALGWDGHLHQCKEKFGGLRFYTGALYGDQRVRIRQAEKESEVTCEVTGERGELRYDIGWIRCLSDDEYQKELKRQKEKF